MDLILEAFQQPWAQRALLASVLVGLSCGLLSSLIVLRNMSLIGDALSHSVLPGIVIAFILLGYSALGFFIGAVIAGLLTAVGIILIQEYFATKTDASVGIVFTTMFAIGVIGISRISDREDTMIDLEDFLFGDLWSVNNTDLILTLVVCVLTFVGIVTFYRPLLITTFQPIVADTVGISSIKMKYFLLILLTLTVVAALKVVGVILVVSMLITPAATALLLSNNLKRVMLISSIVGAVSAVLGFMVAIYLDIAPGPSMTVTVASIYFLAGLAAPKKGLIQKTLAKRRSLHQIQQEDILKNLYKHLNKGKTVSLNQFAIEGIKPTRLKKHILRLIRHKLIREKNGLLELTNDGSHLASKLVRAHRLWESYLADKMGLTESQIHADAEILEHHLTDDILDEVEQSLGFPDKDPHGSPIPLKATAPAYSIKHMQPGESAVISNNQVSEHIVAELWNRKLSPGITFEVEAIKDGNYIIRTPSEKVTLLPRLARMIRVETIGEAYADK